MFSPLTDGIDMLARNTGRLLYRVQIPVTPANVYDVLVNTEGQNTLAVISATAVSFVDLSSLPILDEYANRFVNAIHSRKMMSTRRRATKPTKCAHSNCSIHAPKPKRRLAESKTRVTHPEE